MTIGITNLIGSVVLQKKNKGYGTSCHTPVGPYSNDKTTLLG